jgi:hypothetical protein
MEPPMAYYFSIFAMDFPPNMLTSVMFWMSMLKMVHFSELYIIDPLFFNSKKAVCPIPLRAVNSVK